MSKVLQKIKDSGMLNDILYEDEQVIWACQSGYRNILPYLFLFSFTGFFFLVFIGLAVYMVFTGDIFNFAFILELFFAVFLGVVSKGFLEKIIEAYNVLCIVTNKRAILIEPRKQEKKVTVFSNTEIENCRITKGFWGMSVLFRNISVHVSSSYKLPTTTSIQGVGFENIGKYDFAELMILLNELVEIADGWQPLNPSG